MKPCTPQHILVVGATGATGLLLTQLLLELGHRVTVVVRSPEKLDHLSECKDQLRIVEASVTDLSLQEAQQLLIGIDAIASCLGHPSSLKGIFGKPRRLVRDTIHLLSAASISLHPPRPVKLILMNTSGNRNREAGERRSFIHLVLIGLIRLLLPPHADNERAAEVLQKNIGQKHPSLSWVTVRPSWLIDQEYVTPYDVFPSPTSDPIFQGGNTSRINVAHFMTHLITDQSLFQKWVGQMPVLYNQEQI